MLRKTSLVLLLVAAVHIVVGYVTIAEWKDFPHQVSLQKNGIHMCSGSILNPKWGLSITSCMDNVNPMEALTAGGTRHVVAGIVCNKNFPPIGIALFQVSPVFPIDGVFVGPVALPAQGKQVPIGSGIIVVEMVPLLNTVMTLHKADTYIMNQEECEAAWNGVGYTVSQAEVCAAPFGDQIYGSCFGDSGGPMIYEGELVGMASRGDECVSHQIAGAYIEVPFFVNWIMEIISE